MQQDIVDVRISRRRSVCLLAPSGWERQKDVWNEGVRGGRGGKGDH